MVNVKNVSFTYGYEPVLQQVSFLVPKGKKVGIVGPNGAGKSTLLKLLTKEEYPSEGKIEVSGVLAYVPQEVKNDPALLAATDIRSYVDPSGKVSQQLFMTTLQNLEFDFSKASKNLNELSGGQKTKLALARAFLAQPDILLLDEPTNFLDEAGTRWVMHFLGTYKKTVLVISHDLKLLDRHIHQVLFVNPHTHTVDVYSGNYTKFMTTKAQQEAHLVRQIKNEKQRISQMEKGVERLRQKTSDKGVRQRVVLQRRLERIKDALPSAPPEIRRIAVKFPTPDPLGEMAVSALHLHKAFGSQVILRDVNLEVRRGEKVALIGPNGVGKTTLIKMLVGELVPDAGEVRRSDRLNVGYYSQEFATFDEGKTLEEVIRETDRLEPHRIYPFLGRFLFPHSRLNQRIETLSGGEKTRLSIALLMLQSHNLLVLDEPTTYLDVLSQRVILEALKDYQGAMILVSHTKEFVSELKPDKALLLPQNKTMVWSDDLLDKVVEI
jgi:ATPase subunit of ABC transporter with duplicated ATPase domains